MNKKMISFAAAMMLLTGCGNAATQPGADTTANITEVTQTTGSAATTGTETTTGAEITTGTVTTAAESSAQVSDTTAATTVTTTAETTGSQAAAKSAFKTPQDAVKALCEGMAKDDFDAILRTCNAEELAKLTAEDGKKNQTAKEILEDQFNDRMGPNLTLSLSTVPENDVLDQETKDEVISGQLYLFKEAQEKAQKAGETALVERIAGVAEKLKTITDYEAVKVDYKDDHYSAQTWLDVICVDGGWVVDTYLTNRVLLNEAFLTKQERANVYAKMLYNSLNSALTDMDAEDIKLDFFKDKQFSWNGKEFENIEKPADNSDVEKLLRYKTSLYFGDITLLDEICWQSPYASCHIAAVKYGGKIGLYPRMDENANTVYTDVKTAVAEGLKINEKYKPQYD